jgi:hypothetical protein
MWGIENGPVSGQSFNNIWPQPIGKICTIGLYDNRVLRRIFGPKRKKVGAGVAQSVWCLTTNWTARIRSPTEAKEFSSSLCVQTDSGAHPSSCPMGTGGPFPGEKERFQGVTLITHPMQCRG